MSPASSLRRVLLSIAAVLLVAASLPGSFSAQAAGSAQPVSAKKITITIWDQFTDKGPSAAATENYRQFMASHPNIVIKRQAVTSDQMRQTVKTAVASGTGPDVIYYDAGPGYAGVLANAHLLRSLQPYVKKYNWNHRIAQLAREGTTFGGQQYGIPLETDLVGMYYNATLIKSLGLTAPQTFSQLLSFCKQASSKGYIPVSFGDKDGWPAFHQFSMVSNDMIGTKAMSTMLYKHKGNWDTPKIVSGINAFFVQMRDAGCFPPSPVGISYADSNALFYGGKALLYPTGSWIAGGESGMVATIGKKYDIKMMPFPSLPGAAGRYWISGVGSAFFVSSKSKYPSQDVQFIDYLISKQAARVWSGTAGFFLPVAFSTKGLNEPPLLRYVAGILAKAGKGKISLGYNVDVLTSPQFNLAMQNGFQAMLNGKTTAKAQAAALQAAWTSSSP